MDEISTRIWQYDHWGDFMRLMENTMIFGKPELHYIFDEAAKELGLYHYGDNFRRTAGLGAYVRQSTA